MTKNREQAMLVARLLGYFVLLFFTIAGWSAETPGKWYEKDNHNQVTLRVDLFLSTTCPHCQKADRFFRKIAAEEPWLQVHRYFINENRDALERFSQYLQDQPRQKDDYAVPAVFFCKVHWTGFENPDTTGKELLKSLRYCHQQIEQTGGLSDTAVQVLQQWAFANWYESNLTGQFSPYLFVPMMGVLDALNPCAFFCAMALFALLILQNNGIRRIVLGALFLLVVTGVHYTAQAHSPVYYQFVSWLRIPSVFAGVFLITFVLLFRKQEKNGRFYAWSLIAGVFTALVTQSYQQSDCVANFPLIFEQWLAAQQLSSRQILFVGMFYQVIYFLTLALQALLVISIVKLSRFVKFWRYFDNMAWVALLLTGVVLVAYPAALASLLASFILFFMVVLTGWLMSRKQTQ
ncbi:hypothetical protein [Legionella spiritensis]|nr:hypothetical protein [Legionella spiritensis]